MAARRSKAYPSGAVALGKRVAGLKHWRDGYNPKVNLGVETAIRLCENYSRGRFAELMWLFGAPFMGIEQTNPVYLTIIARRRAALKEMDWDVRISDEYADDPAAKRQRDALVAAYERIDNLKQAIDHLQMATFRGFAHCAITPQALAPVNQWNVARDGSTGAWRYNPEAKDQDFLSLGAEMDMDPADYLIREVELPVGRIALLNEMAANLCEKDWNAFVEIYGIPAWLIVGPPNLPDDKATAFQTAAEAVAAGGSGYLPHGSAAQCADAPRGLNPFEARLRYLNEMLVLAGTGGLLTVLAQSGSGTLAGNAHMEAFKTLAAGDAADISEVFQKQFDRRILLREGLIRPGEKAKAWFVLDAKQEVDVTKAVQHIRELASAGYVTDPDQVKEITGYAVTYSPPAAPLGPPSTLMNSRRLPAAPAPAADPAAEDLAQAISQDLKPVADRLDELLAQEGDNLREAARRLLDELPELAKRIALDPSAAAIIEKAMLRAAGLGEDADLNRKTPGDAASEGWVIESVEVLGEDGVAANADRKENGEFDLKGTGDKTGKSKEQVKAMLGGEGDRVELPRADGMERGAYLEKKRAKHIEERRDSQRNSRIRKAKETGDPEALAAAEKMPTGREVVEDIPENMAQGKAGKVEVDEKQKRERLSVDGPRLKIGLSRDLKGHRRDEDPNFKTLTAYPPDAEFAKGKRSRE